MTPIDKNWLIGGAVVAALALVVAVNFFLSSAPAPLAAVKDFFGAAGRGDHEAAYAFFHSDLRQLQTVEEFKAVISVHSSYFNDSNRNWATEAQDASATIEGKLTMQSGEEISAVFDLVKEDGDWQIIAYSLQGESGGFGEGTLR